MAQAPPRYARLLLGAILWVALGLVLRLGHALSLGPEVAEWEADGFLLAWEGRPWDAWNRVRPPGMGLLLDLLGRVPSVDDRLAVRAAMVGLSVVGLLAAFAATAALMRRAQLTRTSVLRALCWVSCLWAVHPTLVTASVAPVPEALLGPALCLLAAGLALRGATPGPWGWLLAVLGGSLAVAAGGLLVAAALSLGLIVYLLPVPRLSLAGSAVAWLLACLALAAWAQRGPHADAGRLFVPDTAWAHSIAVLVDAPRPPASEQPSHADLRERRVVESLAEGLTLSGPVHLGEGLVRRLLVDLLGPGRFVRPVDAAAGALDARDRLPAPPIAAAIGWFDVFVRGGLLLFVLTVLGLLGRGEPSSWPRAGAVAGALALVVAATAGAIGPLGLAPLDLVLLAVAGAGVAGSDPTRARTRRVAFVVGGLLLCSLLLTAGLRNPPLSRWITDVGHAQGEGRLLVDLLEPPGPQGGAPDEVRVAYLLLAPGTPLLRLPEAALRHAEAAVADQPHWPLALEAFVRALVETGDFEQAAWQAESLPMYEGAEGRRSLMLLDWVQGQQRLLLELPRRGP